MTTARSKPRPRGASATSTSAGEPGLRFACGHVESSSSALARARQNARAAWIECARCNVITVAGFDRRQR